MKKSAILLLLLSVWACFPCRADQYLGLTLGFRSPLLSDRLPVTTPLIGYGGTAGCEWLWQTGVFTIEAGLQAAYSTARIAIGEEALRFDMYDTQGKPFVYRGNITDRTDRFTTLDLQVPVLLGIEYGHLYVNAGAEAVYTVLGHTRYDALFTTVGEYDRYYETLTDMPNHGFYDAQPVDGRSALGSGLDVYVQAGIGAVWHSGESSRSRGRSGGFAAGTKWRLGIFFEYGVLNLLTNTKIYRNSKTLVPMSEADVSEYMDVALNPFFSSEQSDGTRLNAMAFGIRLAILFPLPGNTKSCNCKP